MAFLRPWILIAFIILTSSLIPVFAIQSSSSDDVFTINVAPPTDAKDVQVRYFFTGGFGGVESSIAQPAPGNQVHIKTGAEGQSAKSIKLIAYAPGCQFVILSIDDLSSTREGGFQCQKLPTIPLRGRLDVVDFGQQELQIAALYDCRWAMSFFGVMDGGVSPLDLGKASVASDGTFSIQVPDFVNDPSWPQVSKDAGLMFALLDAKTGQRLATLTSLSDMTHYGGVVAVASNYPEITLAVEPPPSH